MALLNFQFAGLRVLSKSKKFTLTWMRAWVADRDEIFMWMWSIIPLLWYFIFASGGLLSNLLDVLLPPFFFCGFFIEGRKVLSVQLSWCFPLIFNSTLVSLWLVGGG